MRVLDEMRELEETNCDVRKVVDLELPPWRASDKLIQNEAGLFDGSKESAAVQTSGGFLDGDCCYTWLSHGTRLLVIDVKANRCITSWNFPDRITSVSSFPAAPGELPLLLVGLDNNAIRIGDSVGHLCIFDSSTSNVLTTIQVPAGVEKACVIHGGADWEEFNEKRPDSVLARNSGLIFAALRNLQHVVIDVGRDLWINSSYEGKSIMAKLEFINDTHVCAMQNSKDKIELTHYAYDLMDKEIEQYVGFDRQDFEATPLYDENLCSVLVSSVKTGCLISGCLGRVIMWQNDGSIGWISPTFDETAYVTHIALLEPSDDPRPFYYLWIVCQSDSPNSSAVLRMYALLFNRKLNDKSGNGSSLYYNLESEPALKFELELERGERVHSLQAVERENSRDVTETNCRRGEDSLLLIGTEERVLLFDLNRWYKEQMPRTMAECRNPNSVMASYRTRQDDLSRKGIIACSYTPRSLREFPNKGPSSPEELFYPNSLTIEWIEFLKDSLVYWIARGVQSELLREITIAGPMVLVKPTETYRRCLAAGLVPFDSTPQDHSFNPSQTEAREMLLSLCLEQRWTHFLSRCAVEWSDGSADYLFPEFLRWGVQRASEIKLMTDRLCVPLFDQSGTNIGEAELRILRFCCQQLECLASVISRLTNVKGDLAKQKRALKRIASYLQVLLWFFDVGLLPESQEVEEDDDDVQMELQMKIPYPRNKLIESYKRKRRNDCDEENKEDDILFIDQLMTRECPQLRTQWANESESDCANPGGLYPPPSLQSLLRCYLTDCYDESRHEEDEDENLPEMEIKHSITIYLLMDLAMLLQGSHSGVDRLIKYPSAFKLSPSLIKLTQAFWLLDHEDYDRFFRILTGQLISPNDIKDWQHKLAINSLLKNDQHKMALVYLRLMKPPLSSLNDQSVMIDLTVEQGLVESAFHARPPSHYGQLLTRFFHACKNHGKLKEILHLSLDPEEEEAFIKFLKEGGCDETRLMYYLQRGRHTEANDIFPVNSNLNPRHLADSQKIPSMALQIFNAFNNTLPEVTKRFANSLSKNSNLLSNEQLYRPSSGLSGIADPRGYYPRPMSQCRDKTTGIYQLAIHKTRETCLRPERGGLGSSNYIPFLAAPCSTITVCSKFAGQLANEQVEANCVTYPETKERASKRTLKMMSGDEYNTDDHVDKKKQKLNETSENLSSGDNDANKFRRLSMSQVCNTPLVQRKTQPLGMGEPNTLVAETPHSILKIRQMLRRDSNSPTFNYAYGDTNDGGDLLKCTSSDLRTMRQIRFSMDRLSGNEDSGLSANENQDQSNEESNNTNSSKNTGEESCAEENFYSPNTSSKSLRNSSILTDSSLTKFIDGPRPRRSLQRTSTYSYGSSNQSQNNSVSPNNTSLNFSVQDISERKTPCASASSKRKSIISSIYCASILSPDTSFETSALKEPILCTNVSDINNESEESDEPSDNETEVIAQFNQNDDDQDSTFEVSLTKDGEKGSYEEKVGVDKTTESDQQLVENKEELEEGELEEDDTFQSFTNSDNALETTVSVSQSEDNYVEEAKINQSLKQHSMRQNYLGDCSLSSKFGPFGTQESQNQSVNYSFTQPIFIDMPGSTDLKEDECNITDDESIDNANIIPFVKPINENEDDEGANLVLSFSDTSDEEKIKNKSKSPEKKEQSLLLHSSLSRETDRTRSELQKEISIGSTLQKSLSARTDSFEEIRKVSPRRSLRSSVSPASSTISTPTKAREIRSTSVTKEVKRILSQITKEPALPTIIIEEVKISNPAKYVKLDEDKGEDEEEEEEAIVKDATKKSSGKLEKAKDTSSTNEGDKPVRKTRAASVTKETSTKSPSKSSEEKNLKKSPKTRSVRAPSVVKETATVAKEKSANTGRRTRANSTTLEQDNQEEQVQSRSRKTRAGSVQETKESVADVTKTRDGSVARDEDIPSSHTRRKRMDSVSKDDDQSQIGTRRTRAGSVMKDEEQSSTSRKTRAGSVMKDEEQSSTLRKTRAGSVVHDDDQSVTSTRRRRAESVAKDNEQSIVNRKTRAGSVLKDDNQTSVSTRSTRSGSIAKDDEKLSLAAKKTRASSVTKQLSEENTKASTPERRSSRASSIAKENELDEQSETNKRTLRKRGNSLPKEVPNLLEVSKVPTARSGRSTSLLKEVILEETSFVESPASAKRGRTRIAVSSPATNTRSRRSSIQSVPDDLEENLNVPSIAKKANTEVKDDASRNRRAASVDSVVVVPAGKRVTRSVLAKAAIIEEVIPEESTPAPKKQPARRKRTTSVNEKEESNEAKDKVKAPSKSKRGRKVSESKDFHFSPPEEAGDLPAYSEGECRTPTFEFSEPAGLQKFITPIRCDVESSNETRAEKKDKPDQEISNLTRIQRRPRTCFVMPKMTKDKKK